MNRTTILTASMFTVTATLSAPAARAQSPVAAPQPTVAVVAQPAPTAPITAAPVNQPAPTVPTAQPIAEQPAEAPPQQLRVFQLRYALSSEVARILDRLWTGPAKIRIVPDARTNALIISASPSDYDHVTKLIQTLDQPSDESTTTRLIRTFSIKYVPVEKLLSVIQQTLNPVPSPAGPGTPTLAADAATNTLLARGSESEIAVVELLVKQLDHPTDSAPPETFKVRIVWLLSDLELPDPPADLQDVLDELAPLGVTDLRLGAQTIVQTIANGDFQAQVMPAAYDFNLLKFEGRLRDSDSGAQQVDLQLRATGALPRPKNLPAGADPGPVTVQELSNLRTTVIAPPNHKVVLGVVPIGTRTSVFVIQLLPGTTGQSKGDGGAKAPRLRPMPGPSSR